MQTQKHSQDDKKNAIWLRLSVGASVFPLLAGLLCTMGMHSFAQAQIYSSTTESGAILLSTSQESDALLLVAAPVLELLAVEPTSPAGSLQKRPSPNFASFIHEASATYQLPVALIQAVIAVESNYNPRALSPKGAQGLMQLMPATARRFGAVNGFDPKENILTGSRYLRWLLDYFEQDLVLAIAAYNAGENAVVSAGKRVPKFAETERYVPRVLALYKSWQSAI